MAMDMTMAEAARVAEVDSVDSVKKVGYGGRRVGAGRKKGQLGESGVKRVNKIDAVLDMLDEYIIDDIRELPSQVRAAYWKDLVEYRRPKLARTESEVEVKKSVIKVLDGVVDPGKNIKVAFDVGDGGLDGFLDGLDDDV